jgi:UDP-N-acetylglucosamine 2-epimerase (non-hydrolysing)
LSNSNEIAFASVLRNKRAEKLFVARRQTVPEAKILVLFGTRPEVIKLAPVVRELKKRKFPVAVVSSGQHRDLIQPFVELFKIKIDCDLNLMSENQTLNEICSRAIGAFDHILTTEKPDLVLVQGDTTTALVGALAAFNQKIVVGHIEAGLRSGNRASPFPEEMNRRIISQLATFHFAATEFNRRTLIDEGVAGNRIFVTGNPVVDALDFVLHKAKKSAAIKRLIQKTRNLRSVLLTTHRRENFGATMRENLIILREFVENHSETALFFPVHPNPLVRQAVAAAMPVHERIFLLEPIGYADFVALMNHAELIVSDSGGVQEEAPSLGKPVLILRENTERPEAVAAGCARVVGRPERLKAVLEENFADNSWTNSLKQTSNPFGDGFAAKRIVENLSCVLGY